MKTIVTSALLLIFILGCASGESATLIESDTNSSMGADDDTDADSDADTNADTDADTDADTGTDADGDDTLLSEEQTAGFFSVDGVVESDNSGFTGTGYANTDKCGGQRPRMAAECDPRLPSPPPAITEY